MSDVFENLSNGITRATGLQNNKVSNFAYTDDAYTNDVVDGVAVYDYEQEQNVPTIETNELAQRVKDKGIRSQAASLPRNAINHFFGRVSYNLNKVIDTLTTLLSDITTSFFTNGFRYSPSAAYQEGDVFTTLEN